MGHNRVIARTAGLLLLGLLASGAHAQDALKRENEQLKAQLAELQAKCAAGEGSAVAGEQRVGDLRFAISSIRTAYDGGMRLATVTVRIRNLGAQPVALNYQQGSLSLVDDLGYRYDGQRRVSGIATATPSRAGVDDVILPGNTLPVTFEMWRISSNEGETIGQRFDINATFGQFRDRGEGRVQLVRNYAVAFTGVPAVKGVAVPKQSLQAPARVVEGVLRNLLGN